MGASFKELTDEQRLSKLKEAVSLIREVEFSYPLESDIRRMFYRVVVEVFQFSQIGGLMNQLKERIDKAARDKADDEYALKNPEYAKDLAEERAEKLAALNYDPIN